jgi:NADPH:quinone reductase-like Zn-dependent oxidoreductase
MKAIRINAYGPPSAMQLHDVPTPSVAPGDVLIKVAASGVNPVDFRIRAGLMAQRMPHQMPLTLGWECAGTIEAVGAQVTHFKHGDRVYSMPTFARGGTYAEFVAVEASQVALMPRATSFSAAAGMPMSAQAAWTAMEAARLQPGQRVLIHGGAGGVGSLALQLAKARGAHVTTTVAADDGALVQSLGADAVIDYRSGRLATDARDMDVVLDTLGGPTQEASWGTLKRGGLLLALTQPPSPQRAEQAGVRAEFVMTLPSGEALQRLSALVDSGALKPLACHEFSLADAVKVHELGEAGKLHGRTVLRVAL